ncbi:hypothetical protein KP509_30G011400 [Ceratopteris richardii]|uniref:holo-[acyl-carrier-protein] synthase n=1 Tax=Ceratopteris richardii TaxID=49495 RepID=A0A8T2R1A4_CERRI|nr:hypothetical protein KP509_30G011400 [Ceratopteris richardii]
MLNCSHFISTPSFAIHVEPRIKFWRVFCHSYSSFLQPPNSRDLHLWCLLSDEVRQLNLLSSYENILPYEERSAMHQKSNKKVQEEYLLTRTLARTLIARYTGGHVNSSDLKFERGRFGKPKIVWPTESLDGQQWTPPQLDFNLSHTESLIICAITGASQVGVDVEMKNRVPQTDFVKFARRKFSTVEAVHMEQLQDMEAKRHFFLRLWNLKEAYGKAIGNGVRQKTLHEAGFTFENFSPAKQYLDSLTGIPFHEQIRIMFLSVWKEVEMLNLFVCKSGKLFHSLRMKS